MLSQPSGPFAGDGHTPSPGCSLGGGEWVESAKSSPTVSVQGTRTDLTRLIRDQPEDIGHWLCWKTKQRGRTCLFYFLILLGSIAGICYAFFTGFGQIFSHTSHSTDVVGVLYQEVAKAIDYELAPTSYMPNGDMNLFSTHPGVTRCDSLHFVASDKHKLQPAWLSLNNSYHQLLELHSKWARSFDGHCFLALSDITTHHSAAVSQAAGVLNALSLQNRLQTGQGQPLWILYTPVTTVPLNPFYSLHEVITQVSIGLVKRVSMLDQICYNNDDDKGCASNNELRNFGFHNRPTYMDKIAMLISVVPQTDGPPTLESGTFLFQTSRLAGWFLHLMQRAATTGVTTADPLVWAAEHILGINENVLQKLALNPSTESLWQTACHEGTLIMSRTPNFNVTRSWIWAWNLTNSWFPEVAPLADDEPSHVAFICSRVLASQVCQQETLDPRLKFTCGDFAADISQCEDSSITFSRKQEQCHHLIPELADKERVALSKHWHSHHHNLHHKGLRMSRFHRRNDVIADHPHTVTELQIFHNELHHALNNHGSHGNQTNQETLSYHHNAYGRAHLGQHGFNLPAKIHKDNHLNHSEGYSHEHLLEHHRPNELFSHH